MKKTTIGLISLALLLILNGCGSSSTTDNTDNAQENSQNDNQDNNNETDNTNTSSVELPTAVTTALNSEKSTLSQELSNTISYMGNEERLAYDVYNRLYEEYGTKQFTNIASKSEYKHITAVQKMVQKYKMSDDTNFTNIDMPSLGYMNTPIEDMKAGTYDIAKIQALYDALVSQGSASEIDALKVGCIIEVVDVTDLDEYIGMAEKSNASDVVTVFNFLRDGSYNHYWSFDKGLKNKGVTEGCCSLGTVDGLNYCHPEYPQEEKGNN